MAVGMQARLLPLFVWLHAYVGSGHTIRPPSPYAMPERRLQQAVLALWTAGVPGLAFALYSADPLWLRGSAGVMAGGGSAQGGQRRPCRSPRLSGSWTPRSR